MEVHGSQLLGTSYKDPITSFGLFQKFSVQNPEVGTHSYENNAYNKKN